MALILTTLVSVKVRLIFWYIGFALKRGGVVVGVVGGGGVGWKRKLISLG